MALRAVVFDFDGVIVDSEPLHFRAFRDCLAPEGIDLDEEEYYRTYLAYSDREAIRIALERHGLANDPRRTDALAERKARLFQESLRDVTLFAGARDLVTGLARELPLAIASGALRAEIEAILAAAGLRQAFTAVVGAEDVAHGKPHPEPFLTARRRLEPHAPGLLPEECLVFEDSVPGIAAARGAGMKVVAVTHSYPADKLAAAHRVVPSLVGLERDGLSALFVSRG
jgi:HAD superfamily hydrolase (TIGR01509 family)